jgi:hypothetical protein
MNRRTYIAAVAALILTAAVRVASTHRVFSATLDEPIHLASGYEWFDGVYRLDPTHPPLARIFFAMPLRDLPAPTSTGMIDRGNQLLYEGNHYEKNLARGRMGNLLFLILGCVAVAAWARQVYGEVVSLIAVALFTNVPAILGHAGLMTTDMSVAATLPLALYALDSLGVRWRQPPLSDRRAAATAAALLQPGTDSARSWQRSAA